MPAPCLLVVSAAPLNFESDFALAAGGQDVSDSSRAVSRLSGALWLSQPPCAPDPVHDEALGEQVFGRLGRRRAWAATRAREMLRPQLARFQGDAGLATRHSQMLGSHVFSAQRLPGVIALKIRGREGLVVAMAFERHACALCKTLTPNRPHQAQKGSP